jgi:hypothetical protein
MFFNYNWILYALELKPDTLSFITGSAGIIISGIEKKENKRKNGKLYFMIGALLTGGAIIFKQQYIFFLFGILLFSIINNNKSYKIFAICTLLVSFTILYFIEKNTNCWFWTVTIVKDDGFLNFKTWFSEHIVFFQYYLLGFFIFFINYLIFKKNIKINITQNNYLLFPEKNIWVYIMFCVFIGALISSFKVGGNSGNTSFGFSVLLPFVFILINKYFNQKKIFYFFLLLIMLKCPVMIYSGINKYKLANKFLIKVQENVKGTTLSILTGSNVYFATRTIRNNNKVINYWMYSVRDNSEVYNCLPTTPNISNFDYIIVENWHENQIYFSGINFYSMHCMVFCAVYRFC